MIMSRIIKHLKNYPFFILSPLCFSGALAENRSFDVWHEGYQPLTTYLSDFKNKKEYRFMVSPDGLVTMNTGKYKHMTLANSQIPDQLRRICE